MAGAFFLLRGGDEDGGGGSVSVPEGRPTAVSENDILVADSSQARAELETLLARTGDKAFRVEYEIALEEKISDLSLKADFLLASASPRFAIVFDAGPDGLDLSEFQSEEAAADEGPVPVIQSIAIITDGEKAWVCQKAVSEEGECQESVIESEEDQLDLSGMFDEVLQTGSEDELFKGKEIRGRKIAGRQARCYSLDRSNEQPAEGEVTSNTTFTVCVDEAEGLPLLIEGTATAGGDLNSAVDDASSESGGLLGGIELGQDSIDASWALKAKSVEFKASDSDFRPPYKVVPAEE
ncbi:MAG: hypothetical protein ACE5EF_04485 [Dehalococcoidia bacterium]